MLQLQKKFYFVAFVLSKDTPGEGLLPRGILLFGIYDYMVSFLFIEFHTCYFT